MTHPEPGWREAGAHPSSAQGFSPESAGVYRFGPFEFNADTGELFRTGRRLRLRPQVGRVLAVLLEHDGRLVPHEALRGRLWDEATHVEWERGLYTCMRELRAALCDDAEAPRYVETLPGRGYRFVAPVTTLPGATAPSHARGNGTGAGPDRPLLGVPGGPVSPSCSSGLQLVPAPPEPMESPRSGSPSPGLASASAEGRSLARRRWLALVLVVASGAGAVIWEVRQSPPVAGATEAGGRVLIGRFENLTGDETFDGSLDAAFRIALERSLRSRSLSGGEIAEALERMVVDQRTPLDAAVGSEICLRWGAEYLVLGGISKVGSDYHLQGQVLDPGSGRTLHAEARRASRDQLLQALEDISRGLLRFIHTGGRGSASAPPSLQEVTTSSLEALRSYSLAMEQQFGGDYDAAVALLERAVALDPEFSMAQLKLGVMHFNRGAYDAARAQFQAAARSPIELTDFERLYLTGWLANVEERAEAGTRTWTQMTRLFPESFVGWYNRGMAQQLYHFDFEGAAESFEEALRRGSSTFERVAASTGRSMALLGSGNLEEAKTAFERGAGKPDVHSYLPVPAMVLLLMGDTGAAHQSLSSWAGAFVDRRHEATTQIRAQFFASEERWEDAAQVASTGPPRAADGPVTVASLGRRLEGLVYLAAAREGDSRSSQLEALASELESLLDLEGIDATAGRVVLLAQLGTLAARSGRLDLAERLVDRAQELESASGQEARFAAWLDVARSEIVSRRFGPEPAIELLERRLARTSFYPYHARATLAQLYDAAARRDRAATEYEWLVRNRGRALIECPSHMAGCHPDTAFNAVALGQVRRWQRARSAGQASAPR